MRLAEELPIERGIAAKLQRAVAMRTAETALMEDLHAANVISKERI